MAVGLDIRRPFDASLRPVEMEIEIAERRPPFLGTPEKEMLEGHMPGAPNVRISVEIPGAVKCRVRITQLHRAVAQEMLEGLQPRAVDISVMPDIPVGIETAGQQQVLWRGRLFYDFCTGRFLRGFSTGRTFRIAGQQQVFWRGRLFYDFCTGRFLRGFIIGRTFRR